MPQGKIGNIQELIEQHVEKGVVVLCGLLLIIAVSRWVFSSPRTADLYTGRTTEQVAPRDVDAKLLEAATAVKRRADAAEFDRPVSPDFLGVIQGRRGNPFNVDTSDFIALVPPPELREPIVPVDGDYFSPETLASDAANLFPQGQLPPAPAVWARRVLYKDEDGQQAQDAVVAHGVVSFPLNELQKKWDDKLEDAHTSIRAVVAGVEVESQSRVAGGQWVANSADLASTPVVIDDEQVTAPEVPDYDGTNGPAVLQAVAGLRSTWQGHLLRPGYWSVLDSPTGQWVDWSANFPGGVDEADTNVLWFHDESLRPMLEYRYRYRLRLVNPLLAAERDVDPDRSDHARQRFIYSQWSQWSQAVGIKGATEFFVSGRTTDNAVMITVVTLVKGQRVEEKFEVRPGQPIGGPWDVSITDPISGDQTTETVDFSTGSILVGITFDASLYQGVMRLEDTQILYLDEQGQLQTRLLKLDQDALEKLTER